VKYQNCIKNTKTALEIHVPNVLAGNSSGALHWRALFLVLALARGNGKNGAGLSMLVQESVALMALWSTRGLWSFSPKSTYFWIRGAPAIRRR
jgi:hypothetical protein